MNDETRLDPGQLLHDAESGCIPHEEAIRQLNELIAQELTKPPSDADYAFVSQCQVGIWRILSGGEPMPEANLNASFQSIQRKLHRAHLRWKARQVLKTIFPRLIACSAAVLLIAFLLNNGIHIVWFQKIPTPDEQQYIITAKEIDIHIFPVSHADDDEWVEVHPNMVEYDGCQEVTFDQMTFSSREEMYSQLPETRDLSLPDGNWNMYFGCYFPTYDSVDLALVFRDPTHPERHLQYAITHFYSSKNARLPFEQSYNGYYQRINGNDVYITKNVDYYEAIWTRGLTVYSASSYLELEPLLEVIEKVTE